MNPLNNQRLSHSFLANLASHQARFFIYTPPLFGGVFGNLLFFLISPSYYNSVDYKDF